MIDIKFIKIFENSRKSNLFSFFTQKVFYTQDGLADTVCFLNKNKKIFILFLFLFLFPLASSAHYVVGYVNNALDGESANNKDVVMWNYNNGPSDNITGTIGPNGQSGSDNVYMLDCAMLSAGCSLGDVLVLKVDNQGDDYVSTDVNITVTSAGFDLVGNLTLNSLPTFDSLVVDDSINLTLNEIDLLANSTVKVFCSAVVTDLDGDVINNVYSNFFSTGFSVENESDDNNYHYSNNSCVMNSSYGNENQTKIDCSFVVEYYAYSDTWNCVISISDGLVREDGLDSTFINSLLSIEVLDEINFTADSSGNVSSEVELSIKNIGNVEIDLSLSGYGLFPEDNWSMVCSNGNNIPIYYEKYNLINSVPGDLSLGAFENSYTNLTTDSGFEDFNLSMRKNDLIEESFKSIFWRIYIPINSGGKCEGNIVVSAVMSS